MSLYAFCKFICGSVCRFFGRMTVIGRENIPATGGAMLCGNHVSYIDPPALGSAATRPVHFMAKEPLFHIPIIGKLIPRLGAFPVKQHTADRAALRTAIDLLKGGEIVAMFPEGTRNPDPLNLMPPEAGVGLIVLKAQTPVIPVALVDTEKLLPIHSSFCKFSHIKVVFGQPVPLDDLYEKGGREALEEAGKRIMAAIDALLKEHRAA